MLIQKLYNDMIESKKGSNVIKKSLLTTLYSESLKIGKDKRNSDSTDDEVVSVVKKFITNTEETIRLLEERNKPSETQQEELTILREYMPRQLPESELISTISEIVGGLKDRSPKSMGIVMGQLKARYGSSYDGRLASELVKSVLSS